MTVTQHLYEMRDKNGQPLISYNWHMITVTTEDGNSEYWFKCKEITQFLGKKNSVVALQRRLDNPKWVCSWENIKNRVRTIRSPVPRRFQYTTVMIRIEGAISLAMSSRVQHARDFHSWLIALRSKLGSGSGDAPESKLDVAEDLSCRPRQVYKMPYAEPATPQPNRSELEIELAHKLQLSEMQRLYHETLGKMQTSYETKLANFATNFLENLATSRHSYEAQIRAQIDEKAELRRQLETLCRELQRTNEQRTNEQRTNEQPINEQRTNEQPTNEQPTNEQPKKELQCLCAHRESQQLCVPKNEETQYLRTIISELQGQARSRESIDEGEQPFKRLRFNTEIPEDVYRDFNCDLDL